MKIKMHCIWQRFCLFYNKGRIDVILIPPMSNANGICNIIDFDDFIDGYSVGFRAKGDYVLDSRM